MGGFWSRPEIVKSENGTVNFSIPEKDLLDFLKRTEVSTETTSSTEELVQTSSTSIDDLFNILSGDDCIKCIDYNAFYTPNTYTQTAAYDTHCNELCAETIFDLAFKEDPLRAIKCIFYLRDIQEGKGEKILLRALFRHLREDMNLENVVKHNLHLIPVFGTWKDLWAITCGTSLEQDAIKLVVETLSSSEENISKNLCAKYAPRENSILDKRFSLVQKIIKEFDNQGKFLMSKREYRKFIVNLTAQGNKYFEVVEQKMCTDRYADIDYSKVPKVALKKYHESFLKHDKERYLEFLKLSRDGFYFRYSTTGDPATLVSLARSTDLSDHQTLQSLDEKLKSSFEELLQSHCDSPSFLPIFGSINQSFFDGKENNVQYIDSVLVVALTFLELLHRSNPTANHIKWDWNFSEKIQGFLTWLNTLAPSSEPFSKTIEKVYTDYLNNCFSSSLITPDVIPKNIKKFVFFTTSEIDCDDIDWNKINNLYNNTSIAQPKLVIWNLNSCTPQINSQVQKIYGQQLDKVLNFLNDPKKILDSERYAIVKM